VGLQWGFDWLRAALPGLAAGGSAPESMRKLEGPYAHSLLKSSISRVAQASWSPAIILVYAARRTFGIQVKMNTPEAQPAAPHGTYMNLRPTIDLDQLAARESEQIEWKENVADIADVPRTLSAFANDLPNLGGGYVVCGAAEKKDEHGFPSLVRVGLTADRLKEVQGKVLQLCRDRVSPPITPIVEEVEASDPGRRILVFVQPSTGHAHTFRTGDEGGKHWIRIGSDTREARNGTLRELLVRKGTLPSWDRRICFGSTVNDLDLLALRDALQRMRVFSSEKGVEAFLSDEAQISAFVPSLLVREPLTNVLRPRNFAILLFGRDPQRFIPGLVALFSVYPGRDRSDVHAERHEIAGTVVSQARRMNELLDIQSYTAFDKNDSSSPNAVKYPKRALYEAMGNALAHRDYEALDPTRVTVFENRIEIISPGSLPFGVEPAAFRSGTAHPRWRNQALAWFFSRLQLAQAEGQGIPTILRSMREEGCPPPQFTFDDATVSCVLPAHPRHALLRELREIEQDLAVGDLPAAQNSVNELLSTDPYNIRGLQLFAEIQTALKDGQAMLSRLRSANLNIERLPKDLLVQFSEALLSGVNVTEEQRSAARRLLSIAGAGRLEERELRRIAVAMLRSHEEKDVLRMIDDFSREHPNAEQSASINQLIGDAYIGLARKCYNAARRSNAPAAMRTRSWSQFDEYTKDAEKHLARAESISLDPGISAVIKRNQQYLKELQGRRHRNKRHRH
jgi:ATP-dependent DNA helicase RecG